MARTSKYQSKNVNKWNIALYVRLSEEDKDREISESVISQKAALSNFLESFESINNYKFYIDDGYTGGNFERPAFQNIMSDILDKKINCVIVKDLSRFGRNYVEVSKYLQVMYPTLCVRFISINDNYDSETNDGVIDTLLLGLSGLMNEEYLKDCSIKSKISYNLRQTRGLFTSPVAPYGYKRDENDKHKLVVDEKVKDVVKFIYEDYIKKQSYVAVTKDLCEMKIISPSEYKQEQIKGYYTNRMTNKSCIWSCDSVTTILKNQVYIGNMVQHKREIVDYKTKTCKKLSKDKWITRPNTHEPIIGKDTFDKVQKIIAVKNRVCFKSNRAQPDNYFSGLIYCGNCGSKMTYVNDKNRKYTFYKCKLKSLSSSLCDQDIVKTQELSKIVLKILKQYIKMACDIEQIISNLQKSEIRKALTEIATKNNNQQKIALETQKELLYQRYRNLEITIAEYRIQKIELEKQSEMLSQAQEKPHQVFSENKFITEFVKNKNIKKLDREIVKALIKKIVIHNPENIEITFNFQDQYEFAVKQLNEIKAVK